MAVLPTNKRVAITLPKNLIERLRVLYPWEPITELAEYGLRLILDGDDVRFHAVTDYNRTARVKDAYAKVEATLEANRGGR